MGSAGRLWLLGLALLLCADRTASGQAVPVTSAAAPVVIAQIDGAIGPASADYLHRALTFAAREHAQLLVLQIDTPGGLDTSMRSIIKDILASSIPVAGFVAPNGARAASAGTYILYASHIAAMAPASNLGAATPIAIGLAGPASEPGRPTSGGDAKPGASTSGDTLATKQVSDAAAYIRSLAHLRGRNGDWAERAVREAVSLPAAEALNLNVVDLVARDLPDLLERLDGRVVELGERHVRLATRDAALLRFEADWRNRLLSVIADPSLALILMLVGVYGLIFEFSNPGMVLPGVVGAICLLLGLFALQMLPVNYAGLALIALGIGFLVAEAFLPTFGVLGVGGIAAFALGALLLIDNDAPGYGVPIWLIALLSATSAAFVLGVAGMAARARKRPLVSGTSTLLGARGELVEYADGSGWALIAGEHWKVHGGADLQPGARVRVTRMDESGLEIGPDVGPEVGAAGEPAAKGA